MFLNLEISKEAGKKLDKLAKAEFRTRRSQATKLIEDAIEMVSADDLSGVDPNPSADVSKRNRKVVKAA